MDWITAYLDYQEGETRRRRVDAMVRHRSQAHLAYTVWARKADDYDAAMGVG